MQDRYYVIAMIVILAICCLGGYVAVSGYLNSNPQGFSLLTPQSATTPIVVVVPTDTPGPTKPAATTVGARTAAPVPSPLGAFQTIAASTTQLPPTPTTARPANPPTAAPTSAAPSCSGFAFCPKGGPLDYNLGVGGDPCPRNYIWGRVVDSSGRGIPNVRIRYKLVATGESDSVVTKASPDPPGIYNIPTGQPGSAWILWVVDSNSQVSPQVPITTRAYPGGGDCPTRIDFVQQ